MINRDQLCDFLDDLLAPKQFQDYGPNGLQVEGTEDITKIAFAVSATRDSIAEAVKQKAQALIVHHGLFWRFHGPKTVTGPFAKRLKPLIQHDINLIGYHLPLDAHIEFGNAAGLAKAFGMENLEPFAFEKGAYIGIKAELKTAMSGSDFSKKLESVLGHSVLHACPSDAGTIQSVGIITGGANSQWSLALADGLDAYITGEMSEHDWNEARESDIHMFAGGHHATERFGVLSLKALLEKEFNIETVFIDSDNPA